MKRFSVLLGLACCLASSAVTSAQSPQGAANTPAMAFAEGGKFKMLYDCRQRPISMS